MIRLIIELVSPPRLSDLNPLITEILPALKLWALIRHPIGFLLDGLQIFFGGKEPLSVLTLMRNIARPRHMLISFCMAEDHAGNRRLRGGQHAKPSGAVHLEELVGVRINREHDRVPTDRFFRVFRNGQGDWCAEIADDEPYQVLVFDYHPTIGVLSVLRSTGVDIADETVNQGAEGLDMRQRVRRTGH
jgi:hypothetical protein